MIPHCEQYEQIIENENGMAIKFPGGTMICCGYANYGAGQQYCTVNLPALFVGKLPQIVLTNNYNYSKSIIWSLGNRTLDKFNAYPTEASTNSLPTKTATVFYIATGRWK